MAYYQYASCFSASSLVAGSARRFVRAVWYQMHIRYVGSKIAVIYSEMAKADIKPQGHAPDEPR